jgi:energy-coupling factor transporter ATP-binding protein EcfA2
LRPHLEKSLSMLSTGSRRKLALVGLLACGATVTCLDQPYAALDSASIKVLREFLNDMSDHPTRSWVIADYQADPQLSWRQVISLDQSVRSEATTPSRNLTKEAP